MEKKLVRILLADDFARFRTMVASMLEKQAELQVIGTASNGLEAVLQAEQLKPDLILLDIGLPKLNGIEAARQIRLVSPKSIILFLSANASLEIAQEALRTGARGYVFKADATDELLMAVNTVLSGKRFVSDRFTHHGVIWRTDVEPPSEQSF